MNTWRASSTRMIGRDHQLRYLEDSFTHVEHGEGRVVFIAGEAGGGKTRLLQEFLGRFEGAQHVRVFEGYCYEDEPAMAYGPFIDGVRRLVRSNGIEAIRRYAGPWLGDLGKLVPELAIGEADQAHELDAPMQKRRLFEALYQLIRPQKPGEYRIVALEDVHWSDQTSQELLRYLARAIDHDRVLIACTYRSDEIHRRHPLTQMIAHLSRERLYYEAQLPPLTQPEVAAMVEGMVGRAAPEQFSAALLNRTEGNPFFVEEIVKSLLDTQPLDRLFAPDYLDAGLGAFAVPVTIKASILSRTHDLDQTTIEVLNYAAVIGRFFAFETLLQLTGLSETALLHALEQLMKRRLIDEDARGFGDDYCFHHELIREAVYDDLLGRERRIRHRAVLRALEAQAAEQDALLAQLAYHSVQAREASEAARYSHRAGDQAVKMYAYREAVTHYDTALEFIAADDLPARAELAFKLAEAATPLGDPRRSICYWRDAQALHEQLGNRRQVADIHCRLGRAAWLLDDKATAFAHTRTAIAMLDGETPCRELAMAYSALSQIYMLSGEPEASIEWGDRAIELARGLGEEALTAHSMNNIGVSLTKLGRVEEGLALLERSLELSKQAGLASDAIRAYHNLGGQLLYLGQFERGVAMLREGTAYSEQTGWAFENRMLPQLSWSEIELGNWQQAQDLLSKARDNQDSTWFYAMLRQSDLWLRQGRLDQALGLLEPMVQAERFREAKHHSLILIRLARLYLVKGRPAQATETLDRMLTTWREAGSPCKEDYIADQLELYIELGKSAEIAELAAVVRAMPVSDKNPCAQGERADLEGLMAFHEGRCEEAAQHFAEAVAIWDGLRFAYQGAIARRRWVEAQLQVRGSARTSEISRELHLAHDAFEHLGAALELSRTEALIRQHNLRRERPAGRSNELTPRESQVIALLARGLSNRAIAEELVISPKTAEIHVSNILGKLSLNSRSQVAAYALEQGLVTLPPPDPADTRS